MIEGCNFRGKDLKFYIPGVDLTSNIFTIVVGRNGAGKSLLLRQLIASVANVNEVVSERSEYYVKDDVKASVSYVWLPTKIIASSTSPFDKFPVDKKNEYLGNYDYVGLKGLYSHNLSLSYMSRIIGRLVRSINSDNGQLKAIMNVFAYMGYHGYMEARMMMEPSPTTVIKILASENPREGFLSYLESRYRKGWTQGPRASLEEAVVYVDEILNAYRYFARFNMKPRLDLVINQTGVFEKKTGARIDQEFDLLLRFGFLRLRDITLHKIGVARQFRINDASSGEQCVLMALLGIASNIEDGALVCIDEPEVCLHPEWQERFIGLLIDSFSSFARCHFVIATHSPQIISSLSSNNCYVLDIQKNETIEAGVLNKRSADFQLASVFGAPGYKNEYLSRELLNALVTLGSGVKLSPERIKILEGMIELRSVLRPSDPVLRLIDLLTEALEEEEI